MGAFDRYCGMDARWILVAALAASLGASGPDGVDFACPRGSVLRQTETAGSCETPDGVGEGPFWARRSDGTLRIYGASHRGETEGRWRSWHANGRVSVEASYRAGELVGPFQMWDEGGRLVYAGTHDANGEMDGTWTRWYANGNGRIRWEMRHGVAHGSVAAWWEDGARKFAGRRADGLRDGEWTWWSRSGDVVARCRYERNAVVDGICGSDDPPPR